MSGPVAAGKSTLAKGLAARYDFRVQSTRDLIALHKGALPDRTAYQQAGDALDQETDGQWVATALAKFALDLDAGVHVVVDSVRIQAQVKAVRRAFGPRVTHVHLKAPLDELARRYGSRAATLNEPASYETVRSNATESGVHELQKIADIVIDTQRSTDDQVIVRVAANLGLYGRGYERLVDVLIGGQYGSEGKGQIAACLAPEYAVLVRVGGPNAGHKVYEEPKPITFHQLPSGTLRNSSCRLVIGPGAVISLNQLTREIADFEVSQDRLAIDPQAMLIEDADVEIEGRLVKEIGSTGQGVGAATVRKILRKMADPSVRLAKDEPLLRSYIRESASVLDDAFTAGGRVLVEGTQGTGLSIHHGDYPYVTSRDTTASGCLAEAGMPPTRVRKVVMVCRTYPIRVQNPRNRTSGPMAVEISLQEISERSGVSLRDLEVTETTSTTKRRRRIAEFDWSLLRKASSLNGPTDVALTFADYLDVRNREARRFEQLTQDTIRFVDQVERVAAAPVSLIATRFDYRSIIDRRSWRNG